MLCFLGSKGDLICVDDDAGKLGEGGEGAVYKLLDNDQLVCKFYAPEKRTPALEEKLLYMMKRKGPWTENLAAWPEDVLYNDLGQFVGYTMPKIDGQPLTAMLRPRERTDFVGSRYSTLWPVLVARNYAYGMQALHDKGCVIGDPNTLNIVLTAEGVAVRIDCDSICVGPFSASATGVTTYLPPELQGAPTYKYDVNTDNFSLAIVLFQLLMGGCHPFAAHGQIEENIKNRYSPYLEKGKLPMDAPDLAWVGPQLTQLFRRAFLSPANDRPQAREFAAALDDLLGRLRNPSAKCSQNPQHRFVRSYTKNCPFCAVRERRAAYEAQFTRRTATAPQGTATQPAAATQAPAAAQAAAQAAAAAQATAAPQATTAAPAAAKRTGFWQWLVAYSVALGLAVCQPILVAVKLILDGALRYAEFPPVLVQVLLLGAAGVAAHAVRRLTGPAYSQADHPIAYLFYTAGLVLVFMLLASAGLAILALLLQGVLAFAQTYVGGTLLVLLFVGWLLRCVLDI